MPPISPEPKPSPPQASRPPARHPVALSLTAALATLALLPPPVPAATSSFVDGTYLPSPDRFQFTTTTDSTTYYILGESADLDSFQAIAIDFAAAAPVWEILFDPASFTRSFYRVGAVSVFAPLDSDRDGIDDVYEMNHPDILDPLDPTDANLDPDGNGLTHLQEYLATLFSSQAPPQVYSREVTSFNFGAPRDTAISRELTTFNFGEPASPTEAISRELSVYNGSGPLPYPLIPVSVSRELTVYNLGEPSSPIETISQELSVYNGSGPIPYPAIPISISREVTVFNFGEPTAPREAISREVTVFSLAPQD